MNYLKEMAFDLICYRNPASLAKGTPLANTSQERGIEYHEQQTQLTFNDD